MISLGSSVREWKNCLYSWALLAVDHCLLMFDDSFAKEHILFHRSEMQEFPKV